jgi:hypothetical protein
MESVKPRVTAKDFFLWLSTMAFLYGSVIAFIALAWSYIDAWFPDPLKYYDPYTSAIRFAIAALIVVFPIFIVLTRILHQDLRKNPERRELWVRRWLIYLTLFFAGITIATDLVVLVNQYLQGDLRTTFALKCLAILLVVGAVFAYYAYELKGVWERQKRASELIGVVVSFLAIAAIVGAFFTVGSPETARLLRLDERRVQDLQTIQWQLVNYWQTKQVIPVSADALNDPLSNFTLPTDPETGEAYRYERISNASFKLCATFKLPSRELPRGAAVQPMYPGEENWQHGEGEQCFDRTIDPERYPPYTKTLSGF